MKARDRDLINGMRSSVSARDGRFIALSVMGDAPFTAEMLERRDQSTTAVHYYAAPEDCDLTDPEAWKAANPGIEEGIKSLAYMMDEAQRCLASPADERAFRAFDLNQPQSPDRELICSVADWMQCTKRDAPRGGNVCLGIDIGGSNSMTAAVAIWETGRVESWAAFGGVPGLLERGRTDGVGDLYRQMMDAGELIVYADERVTPVEKFIQFVAECLEAEHLIGAGADRFRRAEVIQSMSKAGVRWPMVWRGTGASAVADGSHDVRSFQRCIRAGDYAMPDSLLWRYAIRESDIRYDGGGNPALDKRRHASRIDILQAAVIAAGLRALADKGEGGNGNNLRLEVA